MTRLPIDIAHTLWLKSCEGCTDYDLTIEQEMMCAADGKGFPIGQINCEHYHACERIEQSKGANK